MPADRKEQIRQLPSGKWQLRYYDRKGVRHSGGAFPTQSAARRHYRDEIEPGLNAKPVARRDLTVAELVDTFLERHRQGRLTPHRPDAQGAAAAAAHDVRDGAGGRTRRDDGRDRAVLRGAAGAVSASGDARVSAGRRGGRPLRLPAVEPGEGVGRESGASAARRPRVHPAELAAVAGELDCRGAAAVRFAAATGLRPAEWANLERRDLDRARSIVTVRGTKTLHSRREVPLSVAAAAALDSLPARIDSTFVFAAKRGGPFDVENFRRREWGPAIDAAGIAKPARLYDLRSTFASNALAAGLTVYELARVLGSSVRMIEAHYGAMLDTAHESLLQRLDSYGALAGHAAEGSDA